ncbi:MAG: PilZ domain-containing protein [Acidobacteriia bacterium]|nr:PilZ domain-containing protein [Terriglobia bacterium]
MNFPAECSLEEDTFPARALNLGGGGLFLSMPRQLAPGKALSVRFRPAKHLPAVEASGRVIYQLADQGVGIEFTEIKPEDRQRLLRLILRWKGAKRKYPRKPFVAQIEHEAGVILGVSSDLSVGGMFIKTKEPLAEGSNLKMRFYLNGGPMVRVAARVRYVVKGMGVGVQFIDLLPADQSRIDVYVTKGESSTEDSN